MLSSIAALFMAMAALGDAGLVNRATCPTSYTAIAGFPQGMTTTVCYDTTYYRASDQGQIPGSGDKSSTLQQQCRDSCTADARCQAVVGATQYAVDSDAATGVCFFYDHIPSPRRCSDSSKRALRAEKKNTVCTTTTTSSSTTSSSSSTTTSSSTTSSSTTSSSTTSSSTTSSSSSTTTSSTTTSSSTTSSSTTSSSTTSSSTTSSSTTSSSTTSSSSSTTTSSTTTSSTTTSSTTTSSTTTSSTTTSSTTTSSSSSTTTSAVPSCVAGSRTASDTQPFAVLCNTRLVTTQGNVLRIYSQITTLNQCVDLCEKWLSNSGVSGPDCEGLTFDRAGHQCYLCSDTTLGQADDTGYDTAYKGSRANPGICTAPYDTDTTAPGTFNYKRVLQTCQKYDTSYLTSENKDGLAKTQSFSGTTTDYNAMSICVTQARTSGHQSYRLYLDFDTNMWTCNSGNYVYTRNLAATIIATSIGNQYIYSVQ